MMNAEELNAQFFKAFSEGTAYTDAEFKNKRSMDDLPEEYSIMDYIDINVHGVEKLLYNLNPNKATGPDGLNPQVLKTLAKEIAPILTVTFSSFFITGHVLSDWKTETVALVFKKGGE